MWLHKHQQNKTNEKSLFSQWWVVEPDQIRWGARVKMTVLKSLEQSL